MKETVIIIICSLILFIIISIILSIVLVVELAFKNRPIKNVKKHEKKIKKSWTYPMFSPHLDWYNKTPKDLISIETSDHLKLYADFYKHEDSHVYILVLHGYGSTRKSSIDIIHYFYDLGYNVIAPSVRGHDETIGVYFSMGDMERFDHKCWIEKIAKQDPDSKIIMYGRSMGAAVSMMTIGLELPPNVKCLIEDSGYTKCTDVLRHLSRWVLPIKWIVGLAAKYAKHIHNFDIETSSIDALKKTNIPVLFIHGTKDSMVPYYMMDKLYNACNSPKEKATFNSQHVLGHYDEKERYEEIVINFINKYL